MITFNDVRLFCQSRVTEIVLAGSDRYTIRLHGEFDSYGDFFTLVASDIEYLEIAGGFTVSDMRLVEEVRELGILNPKWARLEGEYSGPAVAFLSADSGDWASESETFVVVANTLEWTAGTDWEGPAAR